ncbi:MAG: tetratricopeptide repeat protein [Desulfobulbaceae bacterium]|nr:tetratricopeptide repeat protein [Desulfobulbaceae bacterium]
MLALLHRQGGRPNSLHRLKFFVAAIRCCAISVFILPLFITGCGVHQPSLGQGTASYRTLPDKYQKKALNYEVKGQLREAIQSWWIVLSFHPDDVEIKGKISALNQEAMAQADGHFKKGVNYYQKGRLKDARREFLLVLAYDQDHQLALDYLKTKLQRPVFRTYAVQAGDTVRDIAEKEYSDPQKFFLITAFNDVDSSKELVAGTLLQLPLLGKNFLGKKDSAQNMPKYTAMPTEAPRPKNKSVATYSPEKMSQEASQTRNEKQSVATNDLAKYQQARKFLEQEEYEKSYKMLLSVDIDFRDVRQLKATTEVFLQQEADAHYRKGISYFLSENLDKAIEEWVEVLRLRPNHLKAQKDLQNARKMQKKVEKY